MFGALFLAALLHAVTVGPADIHGSALDRHVTAVYHAGGLDAVAVVSWEDPRWDVNAICVERDRAGNIIGTSFGLFMLFDCYHRQWRGDIGRHIQDGAAFLVECKRRGPSLACAYSWYNSWSPMRSLAAGRKVERMRDSLAMYLWRNLR